MILNLGSLAFNANIDSGGGTPAWGTEMGQGEGYKFAFEDMSDFFTGLVYTSIPDLDQVECPLGKGGNQRNDYDFVIASLFNKIYVNGKRVNDAQFLLLVIKKIVGDHHVGRRTIKYNPRMTYREETINENCYNEVRKTLGLNEDAAWFINEINIINQDELHFVAYTLNEHAITYTNNNERKKAFLEAIKDKGKANNQAGSPGVNNSSFHQLIFYGTPGSGKSFTIRQLYELKYENGEYVEDEDKMKKVIRTTFHPDTDYATFVGCYKPITYLKDGDKKISYEFVPQAFTNAYVKAWNDPQNQYTLIIEEINRGNCAQIFGDLFQLLDRNEYGYSDYPINADNDLREYLEEKLLVDSDGIKDGKLCLPPNLNIVASMNTSDQSLFPMDSAFKRRWAWEYVPIDYANKKSSKFTITIGNKVYLWHDFLRIINDKIKRVTSSEDKQMGNFFIKQSIDEKELKDKVMFYLWSEVGKDNYQTNDAIFFRYKEGTQDKIEFSFNELYQSGTLILQQFMSILGVKELSSDELLVLEEERQESNNQKNFDKYSINGSGEYNKTTLAYEVAKIYINSHPNETALQIVETWRALNFKTPNLIETSEENQLRATSSKDNSFGDRSFALTLSNGEIIYISKNFTLERILDFIEKVNAQNWNIHIETI